MHGPRAFGPGSYCQTKNSRYAERRAREAKRRDQCSDKPSVEEPPVPPWGDNVDRVGTRPASADAHALRSRWDGSCPADEGMRPNMRCRARHGWLVYGRFRAFSGGQPTRGRDPRERHPTPLVLARSTHSGTQVDRSMIKPAKPPGKSLTSRNSRDSEGVVRPSGAPLTGTLQQVGKAREER